MTADEVLSREAKEGVEAGVLGTSQPHIPFLLPYAGVNRCGKGFPCRCLPGRSLHSFTFKCVLQG